MFLFTKIADNLEEVNVPIMKSCKSISDINGNEICAGEADGGHDACQGRRINIAIALLLLVA